MNLLIRSLLFASALASTIPYTLFAGGDETPLPQDKNTTTCKAHRVLTDEEIDITSRTFDKFIDIIAKLEFSDLFKVFRSDFPELSKDAKLYEQLNALDTALKRLNTIRSGLTKAKSEFLEFAHNQRLNMDANRSSKFDKLVQDTFEPVYSFILDHSINNKPTALLDRIKLAIELINPYATNSTPVAENLFSKKLHNYLVNLSDALSTSTFIEQYKEFIASLENLREMSTYSDDYRAKNPISISEVDIALTDREKTALRLRYNPSLSWLYETDTFFQGFTKESKTSSSGIFTTLEETMRTIPGVDFHKGETAFESFEKAIKDAARSAEEAYISPLTQDAVDFAILKRQEGVKGFLSPSHANAAVKFSSGVGAFFTGPLGRTYALMSQFFTVFQAALEAEFLKATTSSPTIDSKAKQDKKTDLASLVERRTQFAQFLESFKTLQNDFQNAETLTLQVINGGDEVNTALEILEKTYGTTAIKRAKSISLPKSNAGSLSPVASRNSPPSDAEKRSRARTILTNSTKSLPDLPSTVTPAVKASSAADIRRSPGNSRDAFTRIRSSTAGSNGSSVKTTAKKLERKGLDVSKLPTEK